MQDYEKGTSSGWGKESRCLPGTGSSFFTALRAFGGLGLYVHSQPPSRVPGNIGRTIFSQCFKL